MPTIHPNIPIAMIIITIKTVLASLRELLSLLVFVFVVDGIVMFVDFVALAEIVEEGSVRLDEIVGPRLVTNVGPVVVVGLIVVVVVVVIVVVVVAIVSKLSLISVNTS